MRRESQGRAILRVYAASMATYAIGFALMRVLLGILPTVAGHEERGPVWVFAAGGAVFGLVEGTGSLAWRWIRFGRLSRA